MTLLSAEFAHLDSLDARIYLDVRDHGPVDRDTLQHHFPDHSELVDRLEWMRQVGLIEITLNGPVRHYYVPEDHRPSDDIYQDLPLHHRILGTAGVRAAWGL